MMRLMMRPIVWPRRRAYLSAVALVTVTLGASSLGAQQAEPANTPPTDTLPTDTLPRDTIDYVLEPLTVAVARERSVPPPVASLTVDPARVRASQASDPYLMLRDVAAIEVHDQGQGPGFASNVVMRGFTSDHSADVLLVIDGVPVNLPAHGHVEGFADWNVLMPASVSSLRVIHGNASPLYGDFALAGAVEVFTRADADSGEAYLSSSHFGDLRGGIATGRRGERGGFFVAAEGRRQEGWRDNSDYGLGNALIRGWREVGGGRLEGGASLYRTQWNSPGFLAIPEFNEQRLTPAVDASDGGESQRFVAHTRYARSLGEGRYLNANAWWQASDYSIFLHIPGHAHDGGSGALVQSGEWDRRSGVGGQVELGRTWQGGDLTLGLSGRFDAVDYAHAATFRRDILSAEIELDATHRAGAVYGRWRQQVGDRLGVDIGARLDVLRHASTPLLLDGARVSTAPETAATNVIFGPKLGARYLLSGPWSLRASTSRGFRSPVGIIGDPTREPYLSWSHELGLTRSGERIHAEVSLFRIDVDNERVQDPVTLASSGAGQSTRQGIDGHLEFAVTSQLEVSVGGTWNHARLNQPYADAHDDHPHDVFAGSTTQVTSDNETVDLRVPGVAAFSGHIQAEYRPTDRVSLRSAWQAVGPHMPIGEPGVDTRSYSLLDFGVSLGLGQSRMLDVELGNALGVRFVELRSSGYVTPGMPRMLRVQLRVSELGF